MEDAAYFHYLKLKYVNFDAIPLDQWHVYFKNLVILEGCFLIGYSLGHIHEYPFRFTIINYTPIKYNPIVYQPKAHSWISCYMECMCTLSVYQEFKIGKEADPVFLSSMVLVEKG